MHLTKTFFATALTCTVTTQAFALEPLACHPSQDELVQFLKAKFSYKSKTTIKIPKLQGNVYKYESRYLYVKNPKNADYSCGYYGEGGQGRNVTHVDIKHLNKDVECVNMDMLRALEKLKFIEGKRYWYPLERRHAMNQRKSSTWPEFEKWLEVENGVQVWRGQASFELVKVVDKRTSYGESAGSMSLIYDWKADPLTMHYTNPDLGYRRKAEIRYFCDKFTKTTKFEYFRYDDLSANGLNQSYDLNK